MFWCACTTRASAAPTCTSTSGTSGRRRPFRVPMAIGHEFVGEVVAVGSNVNDFFAGDIVSGEGHVVCGRCRNCLAGRRHLCAYHAGRGRQPARRVRRIHRAADVEHLAPQRNGIHRGGRRHLRPLRQRRAHRALVSGAGRGRADHGRGAHRHHGHSRRKARGRAARSHHRSESLPPGTGPQDGRDPRRQSHGDAALRCAEATGHDGRIRRRPGDVGQSRRPFAT